MLDKSIDLRSIDGHMLAITLTREVNNEKHDVGAHHYITTLQQHTEQHNTNTTAGR